jgi:hypothetical protein
VQQEAAPRAPGTAGDQGAAVQQGGSKSLNRSRSSCIMHAQSSGSGSTELDFEDIHLASLRLPPSYRISTPKHQSIRDAVDSLALNGRLDKLVTISLNECDFIRDVDLTVVLSKCYGSVKSIDIRYCGLTESVAAYIKCCTKLEAFSAKGNESAAEMVEIFQLCWKLRKLDLVALLGVTPNSTGLSDHTFCALT